MNKEFIRINDAVFDYKQYIMEVDWLKYNVKRSIISILEKDFIVLKSFEESYDRLSMDLYNKEFDMIIRIECFKKTRELFV